MNGFGKDTEYYHELVCFWNPEAVQVSWRSAPGVACAEGICQRLSWRDRISLIADSLPFAWRAHLERRVRRITRKVSSRVGSSAS